MTVCVRTKIISYPRLAEVNMFVMSDDNFEFVWGLGIFQPLSGMSDLGKQVGAHNFTKHLSECTCTLTLLLGWNYYYQLQQQRARSLQGPLVAFSTSGTACNHQQVAQLLFILQHNQVDSLFDFITFSNILLVGIC